MPFTGQLGTPNSELGEIVLGTGAAQSGGGGNTQSISASDSGAGSDSSYFVGPLSGTVVEQSTASDSLSLNVTISDSGTGLEASPPIPVTALPQEFGVGVERVSIVAILPTLSDSGMGSDSPIPGMLFTDFGTGVDFASFVDITPICLAVSGSLGGVQTRLGPEYFLPHWTTANSNRTGLLFELCQYVAEGEIKFKNQAIRDVSSRYLIDAPVLQPLYEWTVNFVPPADRELTITFQATTISGSVMGTARRAISRFDYDTTIDPVWYQDFVSPTIRLRNLFMHIINGFSSSGVYPICGAGTASYLGVVPDTGYYYRRNPSNNWDWISPESPNFAPNSVTLPATGEWQIGYGSNVDLASLLAFGTTTVSWLGGATRPLPLSFVPVSNLFDGYGLALGITRIRRPIESNLSYKGRMVSLVLAPPDTTTDGVIRGIGGVLALTNRVQWDGVSTLVLDPASNKKITSVTVVGVDRFKEINETLLPTSGSNLFYSSFSNWRQDSIVFVNGIPVNNYTVSGNLVSFLQPVTGTVNAIYSVATFNLITGSNGFTTTVFPGQAISKGTYDVLYTMVVNAHTVDQPDYQLTNLLLPNGLPNSLFLDIAKRLSENNPTAFGRARWGGNSTWFEQTDQKPTISRLPIPFDSNTPNG